MHSAAKEILRLETDLRRAVEREEIGVFYQPIYTLKTGQIECFEALARWHHPELGNIPPIKFIPLAEEIGVIDRMCEQVLRRSCREIKSLENRGTNDPKFSVSINLSCRQFGQNTLVQDIRAILVETGFLPHQLKLEITESVFFEHQARAVVMLNQLRESGIEINIDDFGTGYSNLGYLKKLPISALKIDRSFISMIDTEGDEIVRAIITLARNLGLTVVGEGIETAAQLELLKELECEYGQGYLLAKPMSFDELRAFLASEDIAIPQDRFDDISTLTLIQ
jgi:EAL domain-containing protein (putative c-di-GMP-specific phosphodiesterase class I)